MPMKTSSNGPNEKDSFSMCWFLLDSRCLLQDWQSDTHVDMFAEI